jgi:hypothetical protein
MSNWKREHALADSLCQRRRVAADRPHPNAGPHEKAAGQSDSRCLSAIVGLYEWGPGYVDTVTVGGGKLMAQLTDDKPYELKPLNETTFFVDGDDDEGLIVFERGASGNVSRYYIARVAETSPRRKSSISPGCGLASLQELLKISGAGLGASGVSTGSVFAGDVFRLNAVGEHQVWITEGTDDRSIFFPYFLLRLSSQTQVLISYNVG